jgi:hypothetical protein
MLTLYRAGRWSSGVKVNQSTGYTGCMSEGHDRVQHFVKRVLFGLLMIFAGLFALPVGLSGHGPSSVIDLVVDVAVFVCSIGLIGAGLLYPFGKHRIGFWIGILAGAALCAYAGAAMRRWI